MYVKITSTVWHFRSTELNCLYLFVHQTPKKVGAMWTEAGLNWRDFLPEDEDVNKFVTEQVSRLH